MAANAPMNIILKQIVKTTAEWALVESIIPQDVLCIETCADGVQLQKLGDGVHTFTALPYMVTTLTGASTRYDLVTEEPAEFDPTNYYKLVEGQYVKGTAGEEWATDTWYTKTNVAGKRGLVPAPAAADAGKFLRGDGTWANVETSDTKYRITYDTEADALDAFTLQGNDGSGWVDVTDVNLNLFNQNTTIIRSALLPSYVDDIVEGYFHDDAFYEDDQYTTRIYGESGKIYVDIDTSATYRCVASGTPGDPGYTESWVNISNPLSAEDICTLLQINYVNDATIGDMVGADGIDYNLLSTEPEDFDPTDYYKLVDGSYVQGQEGEEWAVDTWYEKVENVGKHGLVPAPAATDNTKFLKGDGTWSDVLEPTDNLIFQSVLSF